MLEIYWQGDSVEKREPKLQLLGMERNQKKSSKGVFEDKVRLCDWSS